MDNSDVESDLDQNNQLSEDEDYDMSDNDEQIDKSDESTTDGSEEDDEIMDQGNAGWANSMAKILNSQKPKRKKCVVLSKSKKLNDIKPAVKKEYQFQIEGEVKEEIKEEKPDEETLNEALTKAKINERKLTKKQILGLRVKPSILDKDRERVFRKIATKGVVQLFNAVKTQQKDISMKLEKAGRLDHRRERVLNNLDKRTFLDVLMGGNRAKSELVDNPVKDEILKKEESSDDDYDENAKGGKQIPKQPWNIFKDDFLTNKKFSNWDKNEEDDERNMNDDCSSEDDDESS